jgi:hypothetical protein
MDEKHGSSRRANERIRGAAKYSARCTHASVRGDHDQVSIDFVSH